MIIREWNKSDDFLLGSQNGAVLEEADIIEAHRFLYLFFKEEDLMNHKMKIENPPGTYLFGKAIQINLSISKGENQDNVNTPRFIRGTTNSSFIMVNMYIYDTIFDRSIMNIRDAEFTLINSLTTANINEYGMKKVMSIGFNFYDKDFRDKEDIKDAIRSTINASAPYIPDPIYYTPQHQYVLDDEIYCLSETDTTVIHRGTELIDDFTNVSVMNMAMMDTLEPKLKNKLAEIRVLNETAYSGVSMYDQTLLSETLLYQDFESMQHGYTYIYDTNMGFNIIRNANCYTPFKKYRFEEVMVGDLNRTMFNIRQHANAVEKKFGPVRMMFTPLFYGDKTDVFFKDYTIEHQPTIKEQMNIDNGNKVKTELSNIVRDADQFNDEINIEEDVGGYYDGL